jgi:hypothetical protein
MSCRDPSWGRNSDAMMGETEAEEFESTVMVTANCKNLLNENIG